jgi:hypothetical protein
MERNWITPNFSARGFYRVEREHTFDSAIQSAEPLHLLFRNFATAPGKSKL